MLDPKVRSEIEAHLDHYPVKSAASIDALKIVQAHERWVSDEALHEVAEMLEMSPEELDGVASFYNLVYRRPVGEHVILLCDSVSCWLMGGTNIAATLEQKLGVELGETSEDGQFTLLPMCCLGDCDHAPMMMIDEDTHRDLTPDGLDAILAKYRSA